MTFQSCFVLKECPNDISSLDIFLYHKFCGYTTVSAYNKYVDLKTNRTPTSFISQNDVIKLNNILKKYKVQKALQNKLGTYVVFGTIEYSDGHQTAVYVSPAANNCMVIGFLTLRYRIIISDSNDVKYLLKLFMFDKFDLNRTNGINL